MTDGVDIQPDQVEGPPDGPNPIVAARQRLLDDSEVTLVVGAPNNEYPLVSHYLTKAHKRGEEISMLRRKALDLEHWFKGQVPGYQLSLVMICHEGCPYKKQCPIASAGLGLPLGRQCPWEEEVFKARVAALCTELQVNPNDPKQYVDYSTIRDLAATELLLQRVSMELQMDPKSIKDQPVSISKDGDVIYQEMINKKYERLDQLNKKKIGLLESLSATRRERIKAGVMTGADPSSFLTSLIRNSRKILEQELGHSVINVVPPPEEEDMVEVEVDE